MQLNKATLMHVGKGHRSQLPSQGTPCADLAGCHIGRRQGVAAAGLCMPSGCTQAFVPGTAAVSVVLLVTGSYDRGTIAAACILRHPSPMETVLCYLSILVAWTQDTGTASCKSGSRVTTSTDKQLVPSFAAVTAMTPICALHVQYRHVCLPGT